METVGIIIVVVVLGLVLSRSVTIRVGRHEQSLAPRLLTGDEASELATARMSPEEARKLAQQILAGADEAEREQRG